MNGNKISIKRYEQAADPRVSLGGIRWEKKWDVCVQCDSREEAEALRTALAQSDVPESCFGKAQPVAWRFYDGNMWCYVDYLTDLPQDKFEPLYTAPPHFKWQGLTDDERLMCLSSDVDQAIVNTEAKLKEKNT